MGVKWVGYAACIGEMRNPTVFCFENLNWRDDLEDLGVDGGTILKCILGKYDGRVRSRCIWLSITSCGLL
jgi:hypothetical protein